MRFLLAIYIVSATTAVFGDEIIIDKYLLKTSRSVEFSVVEGEEFNLRSTVTMPQRVGVRFESELVCDKPAHVKQINQEAQKSSSIRFQIQPNAPIKITLTSNTKCQLVLRSPFLEKPLFISLKSEKPLLLDGFSTLANGKFEILQDRFAGLNAKIKVLLGRELSEREISQQNPFLDLDLSLLPQYDYIYLSTLIYKNDFYGNIISRLLIAHAERGTRVRVIVTDSLLSKSNREKDRALMRELELASPNIKVLRYRSSGSNFDQMHQAFHAKSLVTLSRSQPSLNQLILGGRNIADEFLFLNAPDYSNYPRLMQYSKAEDRFAVFEDLEYQSFSTNHALHFASQLEKFFHKTSHFDFVSEPQTNNSFISVPDRGEKLLLEKTVELIDSAKSQIKIVSPYFLPQHEIENALERASLRGVTTELVTQMVLTGDDFPKLMESVNKVGLGKLDNSLRIYSWKVPKTLVHTKLLIIDNSVVVVGSPNMDQRSYNFDVEGGFFVQDSQTIGSLQKIFQEYKSKSEQLEKISPAPQLDRFLIETFQKYL